MLSHFWTIPFSRIIRFGALILSCCIRCRGAVFEAVTFGIWVLTVLLGTPQQAQAQTFTTTYKFCSQTDSSGVCTDGSNPWAGLIQGSDGNLYGTTSLGGAGNQGTVFSVAPSGDLTSLHSFCIQGYPCSDGQGPQSGLIQDSDGNFYGTTATNFSTVFTMTPSGAVTTLYTFCSLANCADGNGVDGSVVQGTDGNFYGTTAGGGNYYGFGTVFRLTSTGGLTTLYIFCNQGNTTCPDGAHPLAGLVLGSDGNFYGTTADGGGNYGGTVFKITPAGVLTTLYSFCSQANCVDGYRPFAGLILGSDGSFYGTTNQGGAAGRGTVFKITPTGTLTTLYSFCPQSSPIPCQDGDGPNAGLVQASDGNFYGTTFQGGANGRGTVFKITSAGSLTTLYSFCSQAGCADGAYPLAALVQASDGNLYGTTYGGGNGTSGGTLTGDGTVFKIILGTSNPSVTPSTSSLNFGSVLAGTESPEKSLTITNSGDANLIFGAAAVTLGGANANDFRITSDGCSGRTIGWIAPNNTCAVAVAFWPESAGSEAAILSFADNASNSPQSVTLSGTALTPQRAIQNLIDQVNALYSQGVLNSGQDNSLTNELQKAINMMNEGKINGAIANLEDFISEVNDLSNSGVLSSAQAEVLVSGAMSVLNQLQGM